MLNFKDKSVPVPFVVIRDKEFEVSKVYDVLQVISVQGYIYHYEVDKTLEEVLELEGVVEMVNNQQRGKLCKETGKFNAFFNSFVRGFERYNRQKVEKAEDELLSKVIGDR